MSARELVLGGEGLIGRALGELLTAGGAQVRSLDLRTGCDLREIDEEPFRRADRVWFLAWDTGGAKYLTDAEAQHGIYRRNCELSARVFEHLARTGRPFLFVTSQLAGQPTAYGQTKLLGESWARQLGGRVARLWNIYGWEEPDRRSHVITDMVLSGLTRGEVRLMTRGTERRRFLYRSDCARALVRLFDGPESAADLAGPEWVSILALAGEVGRQLSVPVLPGSREGSEWMVEPERTLPGWAPEISLEEGIDRVVGEARSWLAARQAGGVG